MRAELTPNGPPYRPVPPDIPRVPPWQPSPPPPPEQPVPPPRWPFPAAPMPSGPMPSGQPVPNPDVWSKLLDRRIIMLAGYLDQSTATRTAAEVMLLDADGDEPIQLHIGCPDADLDAAVMLAETLDLVQAPVRAVAGGLLGGPVLAVYASAGSRLAHRHAAFHLREPKVQVEGNAGQLADRIAQHQHQLDYLSRQLGYACGQRIESVAADLRNGKLLTAAQAVDYGLVHELTGPDRMATAT